jgi:hypothetical protein
LADIATLKQLKTIRTFIVPVDTSLLFTTTAFACRLTCQAVFHDSTTAALKIYINISTRFADETLILGVAGHTILDKVLTNLTFS